MKNLRKELGSRIIAMFRFIFKEFGSLIMAIFGFILLFPLGLMVLFKLSGQI